MNNHIGDPKYTKIDKNKLRVRGFDEIMEDLKLGKNPTPPDCGILNSITITRECKQSWTDNNAYNEIVNHAVCIMQLLQANKDLDVNSVKITSSKISIK